jgi:hypothetical protein
MLMIMETVRNRDRRENIYETRGGPGMSCAASEKGAVTGVCMECALRHHDFREVVGHDASNGDLPPNASASCFDRRTGPCPSLLCLDTSGAMHGVQQEGRESLSSREIRSGTGGISQEQPSVPREGWDRTYSSSTRLVVLAISPFVKGFIAKALKPALSILRPPHIFLIPAAIVRRRPPFPDRQGKSVL